MSSALYTWIYGFAVVLLALFLPVFSYLTLIYRELGRMTTGPVHEHLDIFEAEIEPKLKINRRSAVARSAFSATSGSRFLFWKPRAAFSTSSLANSNPLSNSAYSSLSKSSSPCTSFPIFFSIAQRVAGCCRFSRRFARAFGLSGRFESSLKERNRSRAFPKLSRQRQKNNAPKRELKPSLKPRKRKELSSPNKPV